MDKLALQDSCPFRMAKYPPSLESHIEFRSTCALTNHEIEVFRIALDAFARFVETQKIDLADRHVSCIITDKDSITLTSFPSSGEICLGWSIGLILYPVHRWRFRISAGVDQGDGVMLAAILEELSHSLLLIRDEQIVKEVVVQIAQLVHPGITPHHLYPWLYPSPQ